MVNKHFNCTIEINGTTLAVEDYNPNHQQRTLIWTHGLNQNMLAQRAHGYIPFELLSTHFRIITYDVRGRGESAIELNSLHHVAEFLANDLLSLADHFDLNEYYLGGTSMGVSISLWAALKAPNKVKKLLLNMPPNAWQYRPASIKNYQTMSELVKKQGLRKVISSLMNFPLPAHLAELEQSKKLCYQKILTRPVEECLAIFAGACLSDLPSMSLLRQLSIPSFILAWQNVDFHNLETAQLMHESLKDSYLVEAENYQKVIELGKSMRDFLL